MHDKCCDPRNHTLSQHHICRPFCAKFSLDRCNCRNTWCIQQAEDQRLAAATGVIAPVSSAVLPKSTESVDTTLSFAINPVISAVEIFQFPKPSGRNTGAMIPATTARILSLESATTFMCKLNVCRNQMIIVAKKITVNALCKSPLLFPTEAALHSLLPAYGNSEVP